MCFGSRRRHFCTGADTLAACADTLVAGADTLAAGADALAAGADKVLPAQTISCQRRQRLDITGFYKLMIELTARHTVRSYVRKWVDILFQKEHHK